MGGGLIHQDKSRPLSQSSRNADLLPFAAADFVVGLISECRDPHGFQRSHGSVKMNLLLPFKGANVRGAACHHII